MKKYLTKKNIILSIVILVILVIIVLLIFFNPFLYFKVNGDNVITVDVDSNYSLPPVKAYMFNNNITNKIEKKDNINIKKIGKYEVTYKVKYLLTTKKLTIIVNVVDRELPNIVLNGEENIIICPNKEYVEEGYIAIDNYDGDITDKVEIKTLNNKIYYSVIDSSGNKKVIFRNIKYFDNEIPKISLHGSKKVYVFKDNKYIEKGYEAVDNCDGNITNKVKIYSDLETNKVGNYKINYSINDNYGNENSQTREVIVYDDISDVKKNGKFVYLTFDDGPASYTEEILAVLKKYNIKATFFVTNQFSNYQNVIKKEYDEGHTVAVHTYSHNYKKIYKSVEDYLLDYDSINQIIFEQTGEYSKLFRFPGGSSNTISKFNKGIMTKLAEKTKELGYIYYDWNVDSMDTSEKDPNKIAENVIKGIEENQHSIVLLHDIKKVNIESVDKIISYGLNNGYTFLPLDENSFNYQHKINN